MVFFDLFSNMAEWDPQDLAAGGIIGASMGAKARKQAEERAARVKPGKYCLKTCVIDDNRCETCVEVQNRLDAAIKRLEQLEELSKLSTEEVKEVYSKRKIEKCSLCGAPFENGNNECPYCGTAYPSDGIDFEIPVSKNDRNSLIMTCAEDAWKVLYEKMMLDSKHQRDTAGDDWVGKIQKFMGSATEALSGMLKQNASEIKQGADFYGVPMSQYISEVAIGNMKTPKTLYFEEQSRILTEQRKQSEAASVERQAERAQKSSYTAMDFLQRHAENTRYEYGVVSKSSCCGNCTYYLMGSNECGYNKFRHPSGASDYCGDYRSM